jgi:hypothetical protein
LYRRVIWDERDNPLDTIDVDVSIELDLNDWKKFELFSVLGDLKINDIPMNFEAGIASNYNTFKFEGNLQFSEDPIFDIKGQLTVNVLRKIKKSDLKTKFLNLLWSSESVAEHFEIVRLLTMKPNSEEDRKISKILTEFICGDKECFKYEFKKEIVFAMFKRAQKHKLKSIMNYSLACIFEDFTDTNNLADTYAFACSHNIEDLKEYCWEMFQL